MALSNEIDLSVEQLPQNPIVLTPADEADYNNLLNQPKINDVTLVGNKTSSELGLASDEQGAKADSAVQPSDLAVYRTAAAQDLIDATKQDTLSATQMDAVNSGANSTNIAQIGTNASAISTIEEKIPSQASSSNQLADKNFVNSSIATETANFIGTFNSLAELEAYSGTVTNNDYAFVIDEDSAGNTLYDRYKYTTATTPASWVFEYTLNNSSFTSNQWEAINSGITSTSVTQIGTNTTAIAGKQDTLVSGTNIKTVNGNSLLGSGNVDIDTLPSQSGQSGKFLTTDGTAASWASVSAPSVMTGATSGAAGTSGLVPAPAAGDQAKYLTGAGTWEQPSSSVPTLHYITNQTGTSITISDTSSARLVKVYKNGILLDRLSDNYSISGTTLTISPALELADTITLEVY